MMATAFLGKIFVAAKWYKFNNNTPNKYGDLFVRPKVEGLIKRLVLSV